MASLETVNAQLVSTLRAKRRPADEVDTLRRHEANIEKLQEAYMEVAAAVAFVEKIKEGEEPKDKVSKALGDKRLQLDRTLSTWQELGISIREKAETFVKKLNAIQGLENDIKAAKENLAAPFDEQTAENAEAEYEALRSEISILKKQSDEFASIELDKNQNLEKLQAEMENLQREEQRLVKEKRSLLDADGPERERLSLIASMLHLKENVHRHLSAHAVEKLIGATEAIITLQGLDARIKLEFGGNHQLVSASLEGEKVVPKAVENAMRNDAVKQNDPAAFVRAAKAYFTGQKLLQEELDELEMKATASEGTLSVSYKASTRVVTILFGRSVYAKLKVPATYPESKVEMTKLERPESSKSMASLEARIRESISTARQGERITDWVDAISTALK